jgi:hypothetical protein
VSAKLAQMAEGIEKLASFVGPKKAPPSDGQKKSAEKTLDDKLSNIKTEYGTELAKNKKFLEDTVTRALDGSEGAQTLDRVQDLYSKFSNLGNVGRGIAMLGAVILMGFAGGAAVISSPWFLAGAVLVGLVGAFGGVALDRIKQKYPEKYKSVMDKLPQALRNFLDPRKTARGFDEQTIQQRKEAKSKVKTSENSLRSQQSQITEAVGELEQIRDSLKGALKSGSLLEGGDGLNRLYADLARRDQEKTLSPKLVTLLERVRNTAKGANLQPTEQAKEVVDHLRKSLTSQLDDSIQALRKQVGDLDTVINKSMQGI